MPIMYVQSSSIDPDVSHPTSFHGSSIRMDNAYKHRSRPVHSGVELARMHFVMSWAYPICKFWRIIQVSVHARL